MLVQESTMTTTVVYLSINGIEQNLEVDLDYACFADVAEAFGFRTLRRIGTKCILSPRLKLKTVLPHENEAYCRFALLGDVQGACLLYFDPTFWLLAGVCMLMSFGAPAQARLRTKSSCH